ncbi:hypothetical protein [Flavobacterium columnare]|uniref:hypothetical protein n=1 Tax=Flavobacterium covae TaxID=2906076 RepID=UPI000F4E1E6F
MKSKKIISVIILTMIFSCKENNQEVSAVKFKTDSLKSINTEVKDNQKNPVIKDKLLYSNNNIEVYQENTTRGDGVIELSFESELKIYNLDKTLFGTILNQDDLGYDFKLPRKIVARYIVPDFEQFEFDAENPDKTGDFITIFINKEPKSIKKVDVDYGFISWNEYIMKSNFKCFDDNANIFKVLKIIDANTILAKTINIEDCGGEKISSKDKIEKEIKWRNNNIMNVEFYNCD